MGVKGALLKAGDFNRRVEILEKNTITSTSGEKKKGAPTSLGFRYAHRNDGMGSQEIEGQLIGVGISVFTFRNDTMFLGKSSRLIIRDYDGEWEVSAPFELVDSRGRQIRMKCTKYGES
ncbi:hypothetical protein ACOKFD_15660 [Flagellimonas sp. S174]|uniref:hypothetical protein n=1 Tax=Flagellimonas sp. S174 TaxID=3410790 RepID=UPI003BF556E9